MQKSSPLAWAAVGIERVTLVAERPVARVDVMTRSLAHATSLELAFGVTPFRFTRGQSVLYAFSRLPAASTRRWLALYGFPFVLTPDGLRPDGPETWVQGGFSPEVERVAPNAPNARPL